MDDEKTQAAINVAPLPDGLVRVARLRWARTEAPEGGGEPRHYLRGTMTDGRAVRVVVNPEHATNDRAPDFDLFVAGAEGDGKEVDR